MLLRVAAGPQAVVSSPYHASEFRDRGYLLMYIRDFGRHLACANTCIPRNTSEHCHLHGGSFWWGRDLSLRNQHFSFAGSEKQLRRIHNPLFRRCSIGGNTSSLAKNAVH